MLQDERKVVNGYSDAVRYVTMTLKNRDYCAAYRMKDYQRYDIEVGHLYQLCLGFY